MAPRRPNAFTIVDLVIVVVVLLILFAVIAPMIAPSRPGRAPLELMNAVQLRGIHQSFVTHSQENNKWFQGLDAQGNSLDTTVEGRLKSLLDLDYYAPEILISPGEPDPLLSVWRSGPFTSANYSYALLQIAKPGARRKEWYDTYHDEAVVLADRWVKTKNATDLRSIWSKESGKWLGAVVWNDNHVTFEQSHRVNTKYDDVVTQDDNIFVDHSPDDALLIRSGN